MLYVDFHILYFANILVSYAASTQQREAVGRFEILLFWLQEHTKKYNQMIISSINEVKIYHSLTYCTKLVNLCLSMLSLPTIEMYAKPSLPGELVYINAKIGKVLRTPYQLSIKQGLGSASGYLIVDRIRREEDIFI